jgi:hypothetical protein
VFFVVVLLALFHLFLFIVFFFFSCVGNFNSKKEMDLEKDCTCYKRLVTLV